MLTFITNFQQLIKGGWSKTWGLKNWFSRVQTFPFCESQFKTFADLPPHKSIFPRKFLPLKTNGGLQITCHAKCPQLKTMKSFGCLLSEILCDI